MKIDSLLLEIEKYTENANGVKEIVIARLLFDKIITEEQAKEYSEKWNIVIIKNGWFTRWAKSFGRDKNSDDYTYKYLKFED